MAVSPDLLLNIKAPAAASKAANASSKSASQPSRDEASSFANVYAKERQAKPAERQDGAAKPAAGKKTGEQPSQETAKADGNEQPPVAETGNALPTEAEPTDDEVLGDEIELDPLLLFGMGGQAPNDAPLPETPMPTGSDFVVGLVQLPTSVSDGEAEPASAGQGSADIRPATQNNPLSALAGVEETATDTQEALPAALLAGEVSTDESEEPSLEEAFGELLDKLDAPKESRSGGPDLPVNRLNPLAEAITQQQQTQQVQRPVMVPGQPVQMQQSGWSEAVVDRVMWLSSQNLKSAEIQLDPAELGRMEVRIDMHKDQTQVTFVSPHAGVRDALEGQMQRLRDMFSQQGMSMDVNVSDQSRGWQGEGGSESRGRGTAGALGDGDEEVVQGTMEIASSRAGGDRGMVDYYA
ncbi:flagellar hook-length control protein FliK [Stutzerimonas stutzeri]|uniref:flagellar hook-length control protein FliK n=1 Tax=Stutzerimonas TaxID=2901164 RepID=UPI001BB0130C|nr:flagellar hook-length control protein FliK [Stutzerimonas stutzeri]QUE77541.1 flagellar hook-length control protein FliK [Stutzerimonas stutzeri]